jgi:hypothetical protein
VALCDSEAVAFTSLWWSDSGDGIDAPSAVSPYLGRFIFLGVSS